MSASVGLERDKKGTLHVKFTCTKCGDTQSRSFHRTRARDIVYCVCGATAALTPRAFAALSDRAQRADAIHADFQVSI